MIMNILFYFSSPIINRIVKINVITSRTNKIILIIYLTEPFGTIFSIILFLPDSKGFFHKLLNKPLNSNN